jgi:hypothetical protein
MIIEVRQDIVILCVREIEWKLEREKKEKKGRKESGASPSAINNQ